MDGILKSKEILAVYESVCERQRVSLVRNTALLKDVERVQRLLAGHQHNHSQLNALKSRYQHYVASVYPEWLSRCNSHRGSTEPPPGVPQTITNTHITPTTITASTNAHITSSTNTHVTPSTNTHVTPSNNTHITSSTIAHVTPGILAEPHGIKTTYTETSFPEIRPQNVVSTLTHLLPRQPDSLTPKLSAPADVSLDLTLSTYSISTENSTVEIRSTENKSEIESTKGDIVSTHDTTDEVPRALNHALDEPNEVEHLRASTILNHTNEPLSESTQASTVSISYVDEPEVSEHLQVNATVDHTPSEPLSNASIPNMDEPEVSELSQITTASNRTVTGDNSPSRSHSPPPPPQFTLSPPLTPLRTSSLPSPAPSPSLPPPTPTRTSSLPPHTPSPPHSRLNRLTIVNNLLSTLNTHLAVDGDAVAIEMYSEPVNSDKMKLKISGSGVLSSNIIKSANGGLNCSTWDVSVVGVVLLSQLSLLTAAHGPFIDNSLLSKDAPLITHPVNFRLPWSQVWDGLLENVQLLHRAGRPLDELAAIFTPPLFTTPSEKACLQLLALFRLDIDEESREDSAISHDESIDLPGVSPSSAQGKNGLLDYSALGGAEDISDQSSLFSEDSAVLAFEQKLSLKSPSQSIRVTTPPPLSTPLSPAPPLSVSSDESSMITPPGYIPSALENSAPIRQSRLSNSSSLRKRLGLHDNSDSELDEDNDLILTPKQQNTENDFDFNMYT